MLVVRFKVIVFHEGILLCFKWDFVKIGRLNITKETFLQMVFKVHQSSMFGTKCTIERKIEWGWKERQDGGGKKGRMGV